MVGPTTPQVQQARIVAYAGGYYRKARYVMSGLCLVMGFWFLYDGFVRYPEQNRKYDILVAGGNVPDYQKHTAMDITLQRLLGVALPLTGAGLLAWWLYRSRGAFILSGRTLHVPGHPVIDLDQIRKIDKRLWERKGIASVEYEATRGGEIRSFILDDFVYDANPMREILKVLEDHMKSEPTQPPKSI